MANWNPVTHPYLVSWTSRASYPANWRERVEQFATEADARAAFEKPMQSGVYEVEITQSVDGRTKKRVAIRRRSARKVATND